MRIVQVVVTLVRGDAIGNFTIMLQEVLEKAGYTTEIYAINIGEGINNDKVKKLYNIPALKEEDILIYQMTEGNAINEKFKSMKCKKVAIYHNVTPPSFFAKWSTFMKETQEKALKDVQMMKDVFDYCIADSEFNKADLVSMGYHPDTIDVIPIITDFDDYRQEPSAQIIDKYNDGFVNILFVGRIVPNKKQEDIIRAFAYYKKHINEKSRLILIGSPFCLDYYNDLLKYIKYLDLTDVIIPGHISFKEILGYYSVASVFLCMSEHEGFCVPLLEAMMFKVPIIAYASTAIPSTMGNAGLVLDEKDPIVVANAIDEVVKNTQLQDYIKKQQTLQLNKYKREVLESQFLEKIQRIIGENR